MGDVWIDQKCPSCNGEEDCSVCDGTGRVLFNPLTAEIMMADARSA